MQKIVAERILLLCVTTSLQGVCYTGPGETGFAASDVIPEYGVYQVRNQYSLICCKKGLNVGGKVQFESFCPSNGNKLASLTEHA